MRHARLLSLLTALVSAVAPAAAQSPLDPAIRLYERAAFDDALVALDAVARAVANPGDDLLVGRYRFLCLLALGRNSEAETVSREVVERHPAYRLGDDTPPRARRVFDDARSRLLPDIVRRRYSEARAHFDAKEFDVAITGFAAVRELAALAASDLEDSALGELGNLAEGFHTLALAAQRSTNASAAATPTASASAPPDAPHSAPVSLSSPPAPAGPPANGVFGADDPAVTPPVVIYQAVKWRAGVPWPVAGAPLGTIEVLIDETGGVIASRMVSSVSQFYDVMLTDSSKSWRYRPAIKDGRAVKCRRVVAMVSGG